VKSAANFGARKMRYADQRLFDQVITADAEDERSCACRNDEPARMRILKDRNMLPKQTDSALGKKMCQIDGGRRIAEDFERNVPDFLATQLQGNQPVNNQGSGQTPN
jgi:hypothetical protein